MQSCRCDQEIKVALFPCAHNLRSCVLTRVHSPSRVAMIFPLEDDAPRIRKGPLEDDAPRIRKGSKEASEAYAREVETGNIEYKLKLVDVRAARMEQLVTQLKWRLTEGGGEALYEIGVEDDGSLHGLTQAEMSASLATLERMCEQLDAQMTVRHTRLVPPANRAVAEVVVRALNEQSVPKSEVRVAFLGGADAGKSTLIAALATGELDDGQGSARTLVMRHMHELESGHTSSISEQLVGFDSDGNLLNSAEATFGTSSPADVVERAVGLVTLLDLCGEEKYLKTTLYGLTAYCPDVILLSIPADEAPFNPLHVSALTSPPLSCAPLSFHCMHASLACLLSGAPRLRPPLTNPLRDHTERHGDTLSARAAK